MNQSMNDEGVCRTAPAIPGLLINWVYGTKGGTDSGRRSDTLQSVFIKVT